MSLLYNFMINKYMITWLVMLAGSIPISFSVKLVTFCLCSCNVSSVLCFQCSSLAVYTSMAIGEYTSSNFLLMSCQSVLLSNLFSILFTVASSYSWLWVIKLLFNLEQPVCYFHIFPHIWGCPSLNCHTHVYLLWVASC